MDRLNPNKYECKTTACKYINWLQWIPYGQDIVPICPQCKIECVLITKDNSEKGFYGY
jgi:hypothetical protein